METNKLLHNTEEVPKNKELIVFDLDGTLTKSKSDMDEEMAFLVGKLLEVKKVAIIGGGKYNQFKRQFLDNLFAPKELFAKLLLFPASGTAFYRYDNNDNEWRKIYSKDLTEEEKKKVFMAFEKTFHELDYKHPDETFGELIEDRGTQITFSALGQDAPLSLKEKWKAEHSDIKMKIAETLRKYLPDMDVGSAGYTSIDVTRKGIDKGYGLRQIKEHIGIPFEDMLFVGDALFPGGNDEAALKTGVSCFEVKDVEETKRLIEYLIKTTSVSAPSSS